MAVPKKKTSKSKRRSRLAKWNAKANLRAKKAMSIAKSRLTQKITSFVSNVGQN